jgi:hypothetical protein
MPMKTNTLKIIVFSVMCFGLSSQVVNAADMLSIDKNFANPMMSLADYNKIYIRPLNMSRTKQLPPPWIDKDSFHWEVKASNIEFFQKSFKKSLVEALTTNKSQYTVVEKEGKGVLVVDVEVISFMPYALREDVEVETKGSGEIYISVRLRDGKSGKLTYIFEGTQAIGDQYQPNSDMSLLKDSDKLFHDWGKALRKKLDEAHAY